MADTAFERYLKDKKETGKVALGEPNNIRKTCKIS